MIYLTYKEVEDIVFHGKQLKLDPAALAEVERCYRFLEQFHKDKVIYGINTGFGPMAQWRVDDRYLKDLQYNIIRSHSTGAGKPLGDASVRAAMVARVGTFLQAKSGIHPDVVKLLVEFINRGIYPFPVTAALAPAETWSSWPISPWPLSAKAKSIIRENGALRPMLWPNVDLSRWKSISARACRPSTVLP